MLKAAIIKSNEALKALTDEQIAAIETLSANDEDAVIAKKLGEVHGQYDRDIEEATGLKRPAELKTYDWMKTQVLPKVKTATDLEGQLEGLKTEKTALETKLANNSGDDALKQKLTDLNSQVTQLQGQLTEKETTWKEKLTAAEKQNANILVDAEINRDIAGLKFKPETVISKAIRESFVNSAKQNLLSTYTPDWVDDGAGKKQLVLRDKNNDIVRNPENGLKPYTPGELLSRDIADVLDTGKQQTGAGTGANGGGNPGGGTLDLSGFKSQVDADKASRDYLMKQGVERGSEKFETEFAKIREENKVAELPIR